MYSTILSMAKFISSRYILYVRFSLHKINLFKNLVFNLFF